MQYDELPQPDMTPVKLIDRVSGAPAYERYFNGGPSIAKDAGEIELILPRSTAIWLLQRDRDKVWAKGVGYVHRFALLKADEEIVARCGRDVLLSDPIDLDPAMREGWNTKESPFPRREVVYGELNAKDLAAVRQMLSERLASNAGSFVKG
jgi:hypothetical protein